MSNPIGHDFMQATNIYDKAHTPQKEGLPQPPLELLETQKKWIQLPKPMDLEVPDILLRKAIEQRKSIRSYDSAPISLEELSYLLWCTQGVKKVNEQISTFRTVPSAGARHAFETFLLINRVTSLDPGLYRFGAINHGLYPLRFDPQMAQQAAGACLKQSHVLNSAVTFFWVAVEERMTWRYMQRGYRYMLLDAGHVCQNLYLAAEGLDCGVCAMAAYDDEALNQFLGVDGDNQFVIYAATCGKKQPV